MILTYACKDTERIGKGESTKKWNKEVQKVATRKLAYLNAAVSLRDLQIPPSNRLHQLQGDLKGYYSVSINLQWRIIFLWDNGNASEVKIVDYH